MKRVWAVGFLMVGLVVVNGAFDHWFPPPAPKRPRALVQPALSNWYWVRGYDAWLDQDKKRLRDHYGLATALNPGNLTYWRLAAQTIAYDFPAWEITGDAGEPTESGRVGHGLEALAFFERSRRFFTADPEWYLAGAFLAETAVKDPSLAIDYLEEAVTLPDFPFVAGQNYVRLLLEMEKPKEAYAFLRSWISAPQGDLMEGRHTQIEAWILSVEKQLELESVP